MGVKILKLWGPTRKGFAATLRVPSSRARRAGEELPMNCRVVANVHDSDVFESHQTWAGRIGNHLIQPQSRSLPEDED